ncbi:MAG: hypothetical protein RSB88_08445, partial [Akkermansia sp.]
MPEGIITYKMVYPHERGDGTCTVMEQEIIFERETSEAEVFSQDLGDHPKVASMKRDMSMELEETYEVGEPELFPGFLSMVDELVALADACEDQEEQQELKKVLIEFQDVFAKDSYDCGETDI